MRLLALFLALAAAVLVPFLLWGDRFDAILAEGSGADWLRRFGPWAWLAGIALLVGDLVLPIPSTAIISALGFIYGPWIGGLIGATGSILAGLTAYGACRALGHRAAVAIAGEKGLRDGEKLFARSGGWLVAVSRWLPLLPEVVACMAGLARMPFGGFATALACGSVPLGFAFAAVGAAGVERPALTLAVSALAPPLLWWTASRLLRRLHDAADHGGAPGSDQPAGASPASSGRRKTKR